MSLNKQKGNMYPFVTHTWNVVKGKCPHDCSYCYMKIYRQLELHFDEAEFKTDLGEGNFIFVGSSCDMWAKNIPEEWLILVVRNCYGYRGNRYLFQSKNPSRFHKYDYPKDMNVIFGVTIESNIHYPDITKAPQPVNRYHNMTGLPYPKMVSIEPILDFDLDVMVRWVKGIAPEFVSIGADSKGHKLPEPSEAKTHALIENLRGITKVYIKSNLKRLLRQEMPVIH